MAEYVDQDKDLIYALDIGTRSIVGIVGRLVGERFKVVETEVAEHTKRAMMDGQIDDIKQVASLVKVVTGRLEERLGVRLRRVSVAAAGRALRTQSGSFALELSGEQPIDAEEISQLETGAVSMAEEALQTDEEARKQFFLVGYTVTQYRLDNYPLTTLQYHNGKKAEADVVATFLPGEVIESLYATMRAADLQVASMTLEPIASMNATIPADLRLLNLALVDIGAGTTDIAACRDGSVIGYTMATVAGDEITESIMRAFLTDFDTAEQMKRVLNSSETLSFRDILGLENTVSAEEVKEAIRDPMEKLADAIAKQVISINGAAPSALFMAGGGSKLSGLCAMVAHCLEMDERRVAIAGNNFSKSAFADHLDLENPELATPLGIAISAGLGLLNDSYVVMLNGEPAKLFRNGVLSLQDILLMNGYTYGDMIGKTGRSLGFTLNGKHIVIRGEPSTPSVLRVNEVDATISTVVHAGDRIDFIPARHGPDAAKTVGEVLGSEFKGKVFINEMEVELDTPLRQGDNVITLECRMSSPEPARVQLEPARVQPEPARVQPEPARVQPEPVRVQPEPVQVQPEPVRVQPELRPIRRSFSVILNGKPLVLPPKPDGAPYYLMDLLEHSGIDFEHIDRPVRLEVNGAERGFQHVLNIGDVVLIHCV